MAYKRRRSFGRKRTFKRRRTNVRRTRSSSRRRGTVVGNRPGLPLKLKFQHKYCQSIALSSTPSTNGGWRFRCNSLYDPDQSGGGHQAMMFDQMSAIYNHYTVIGSRMKITFTPISTNVPTRIIMFINDDTNLNTANLDTLAEQKSGKSISVITTGNQPITRTMNWSAKKTFGGSILGNDELQGNSVSNPTEQSYFEIASNTVDGISNSTVFALIEINYIAIWDEQTEVAGS